MSFYPFPWWLDWNWLRTQWISYFRVHRNGTLERSLSKTEINSQEKSKALCELLWSITGASHRPGTSKQLTLCLSHNEALLESHVGENKGGAGREGVKWEENVKYLYSWIQGNIINGQGCAHMCKKVCWLYLSHRAPVDIWYARLKYPSFCSGNFLMFQPHWSGCF